MNELQKGRRPRGTAKEEEEPEDEAVVVVAVERGKGLILLRSQLKGWFGLKNISVKQFHNSLSKPKLKSSVSK